MAQPLDGAPRSFLERITATAALELIAEAPSVAEGICCGHTDSSGSATGARDDRKSRTPASYDGCRVPLKEVRTGSSGNGGLTFQAVLT